MKTLHTHPKLLISELFKLERCGKYDEALAELRDIWEDTTTFPKVDDFEPRIAAEIILRCGSLIGFIGHNKQLPNAQEKSKNLLTEAHQRFLDIYDIEKVAECENYLALAYWRTGELVEAETWIEEVLSHNLKESSQVRIYSYLIKSMILISKNECDKLELFLEKVHSSFQNYGDDFLNGSYYTNFGIALRNLGKSSEALKNYKLARIYHQKSGHQIYLGTVENNLSYLYKSENDFINAHQAIDNAVEIFKQIKDKTRVGFSLDTKAQIYFAEQNYIDALNTVEKAVKILQKSENSGYLVETYLTKTKILLSLDDFSAATFCLFDAVQIAKTHISEEIAQNLVKEFETEILKKNARHITQTFTEKELISGDLELILPPSISHYAQYQAVRIRNTHLEKIGLPQNSLAIVADDEVKRGDLAAVLQINDESVHCGFYDADFGIVCLEGIDSEPQLLDENEIKVLGKIVGVCDTEKNSDGKLLVKTLQI
jgi:tetratricopeptide (TPR) repeat protein